MAGTTAMPRLEPPGEVPLAVPPKRPGSQHSSRDLGDLTGTPTGTRAGGTAQTQPEVPLGSGRSLWSPPSPRLPLSLRHVDHDRYYWPNLAEEIKELKAQVTSFKKDLKKGHEGKYKLDKMLSVQQSPNYKSRLGFISNNKKKSNSSKKDQVQVKDPTKITCFKCKIEGHNVRSCPLKKKPLSEKQVGKQPQVQGNAQPRVEKNPLPKKNQDNAPIVVKESEKKEKRRTCYICREKGQIFSFCTIGTSSNPIIIDDVYSLRKDEVNNVFSKYAGAQSGVKKRTIWVAKTIVTNLLGPNLVGDQQAKT
ncbi:hypothetical protein QYE76_006710 [Lolium multiflorum]|uniref:CCHC-type domain-containing protein n=1 Tax=Lolium multiflorum TaxID=4521 RepID=A0AAD8RW56_LOLMU|nr:hypothetical protein QYE76_006710 [Lolium multiflorum]